MKEVIAVIRPDKWQATLGAAGALGLTEYTQMRGWAGADSVACAICAP